MPDNTNVNNNAAVVVVGRTAPVPPGQQKSEKSIPVVIASDQATLPVAEQNKIQSEVALSLLGIPRSEVALGIFADVNTYDVNPSEWASFPEQFTTVENTGAYAGIGQSMGWGLTHIPEEAGALIEAPPDKTAVLTSKRFFRYQPGRVSSATFGVKTTSIGSTGAGVRNPAVRKYGIFDNYDGYYWESRNNAEGDNFCVVRRTQSVIYENPVGFPTDQSEDYGRTNPSDQFAQRGSESDTDETALENPSATPKRFGDLVILRDGLIMTHAAVYDPSLLQSEYQVGITSIYNSNTISLSGLAKSVSNATYNNTTGLMVITTDSAHGFSEGKFVTLSGIGMTCDIDPSSTKYYPNRSTGYNILQVNSSTSFTVNVGVSTVPTFYKSGGYVVGLSTNQYVSYSKGTNSTILSGFGSDTTIFRVRSVGVNTITGISTVTLNRLNGTALTGLAATSGISSHVLITPVPFIQPTVNISGVGTVYSTVKQDGMFPYQYTANLNGVETTEGYIDTTEDDLNVLKSQIDGLNDYYDKWVNQNVSPEYWNVYEYRVPRSRFSTDKLDGIEDGGVVYSDVITTNKPGDNVLDPDTGDQLLQSSKWDLDIQKVTMYKIEFSWYGAVGALFLAYVPVGNGEARWVRVHHLRASNQLKVSSLGNATLPITYMVYGGGNASRNGYSNNLRTSPSFYYGTPSQHIVKYGASYYIDGGDRGTVKLFTYSEPTSKNVYGSKRTFTVGAGSTQMLLTNAGNTTDPRITFGTSVGLSTSFFVGAKVKTQNVADQNIEITYGQNQTLYLSSPLNNPGSLTSIEIIPNRPLAMFGLKCKDFIQSSTGKTVRNRTQVYPTRLSTGSSGPGIVKLEFIKSPILQTTATTTGSLQLSTSVNIGKRGKPTLVTVSNNSYLTVNTGVYGYFRGYKENDTVQKVISVLGYLERKSNGYFFYSLNSYDDSIVLNSTDLFLKEENTNSIGQVITSGSTSEFSLATLSSIKIVNESRSPIPNTGTIVASFYLPASGEEYDLSPYFDYNKDYLSFPLTNKIETLYLCVSSQSEYNSGNISSEILSSLTWEEQ
jgi:hypothetical protein